jgi:hypothetical protein
VRDQFGDVAGTVPADRRRLSGGLRLVEGHAGRLRNENRIGFNLRGCCTTTRSRGRWRMGCRWWILLYWILPYWI